MKFSLLVEGVYRFPTSKPQVYITHDKKAENQSCQRIFVSPGSSARIDLNRPFSKRNAKDDRFFRAVIFMHGFMEDVFLYMLALQLYSRISVSKTKHGHLVGLIFHNMLPGYSCTNFHQAGVMFTSQTTFKFVMSWHLTMLYHFVWSLGLSSDPSPIPNPICKHIQTLNMKQQELNEM